MADSTGMKSEEDVWHDLGELDNAFEKSPSSSMMFDELKLASPADVCDLYQESLLSQIGEDFSRSSSTHSLLNEYNSPLTDGTNSSISSFFSGGALSEPGSPTAKRSLSIEIPRKDGQDDQSGAYFPPVLKEDGMLLSTKSKVSSAAAECGGGALSAEQLQLQLQLQQLQQQSQQAYGGSKQGTGLGKQKKTTSIRRRRSELSKGSESPVLGQEALATKPRSPRSALRMKSKKKGDFIGEFDEASLALGTSPTPTSRSSSVASSPSTSPFASRTPSPCPPSPLASFPSPFSSSFPSSFPSSPLPSASSLSEVSRAHSHQSPRHITLAAPPLLQRSKSLDDLKLTGFVAPSSLPATAAPSSSRPIPSAAALPATLPTSATTLATSAPHLQLPLQSAVQAHAMAPLSWRRAGKPPTTIVMAEAVTDGEVAVATLETSDTRTVTPPPRPVIVARPTQLIGTPFLAKKSQLQVPPSWNKNLIHPPGAGAGACYQEKSFVSRPELDIPFRNHTLSDDFTVASSPSSYSTSPISPGIDVSPLSLAISDSFSFPDMTAALLNTSISPTTRESHHSSLGSRSLSTGSTSSIPSSPTSFAPSPLARSVSLNYNYFGASGGSSDTPIDDLDGEQFGYPPAITITSETGVSKPASALTGRFFS